MLKWNLPRPRHACKISGGFLNFKYPRIEGNYTIALIFLVQKLKKDENRGIFFEYQKCKFWGMLIGRSVQHFGKLVQLKISKNRKELRSSDEDPPYYCYKTWAQNRKFDKVLTFEPDGILTRSKRRFVHLGEVKK